MIYNNVFIPINSLGHCVRKQSPLHWISFDVESSRFRVNWPENMTVSIERNIDFAAERLEGETVDVPSSKMTSLNELSLPPVVPPSALSKALLALLLHPRSIPRHPCGCLCPYYHLAPSQSSSKSHLSHYLSTSNAPLIFASRRESSQSSSLELGSRRLIDRNWSFSGGFRFLEDLRMKRSA